MTRYAYLSPAVSSKSAFFRWTRKTRRQGNRPCLLIHDRYGGRDG